VQVCVRFCVLHFQKDTDWCYSTSDPFTYLFPRLNSTTCTGGHRRPYAPVFNWPLIDFVVAAGDNKLQPSRKRGKQETSWVGRCQCYPDCRICARIIYESLIFIYVARVSDAIHSERWQHSLPLGRSLFAWVNPQSVWKDVCWEALCIWKGRAIQFGSQSACIWHEMGFPTVLIIKINNVTLITPFMYKMCACAVVCSALKFVFLLQSNLMIFSSKWILMKKSNKGLVHTLAVFKNHCMALCSSDKAHVNYRRYKKKFNFYGHEWTYSSYLFLSGTWYWSLLQPFCRKTKILTGYSVLVNPTLVISITKESRC